MDALHKIGITNSIKFGEQENATWVDFPGHTLANSRVYAGSMGMMAYEAGYLKTKMVLVCRSQDHIKSADKLVRDNWQNDNLGLVDNVTPEYFADQVQKSLVSQPPLFTTIDGFGVYRVAKEILVHV